MLLKLCNHKGQLYVATSEVANNNLVLCCFKISYCVYANSDTESWGMKISLSLSTLVLNGRDRQGSRFPAKKLRTKRRLAKPSRRFSSIVLQK